MEYKIIKDFPLYWVYENGDIINHKTNKKVRMRQDYVVNLSCNSKVTTFSAKKVIYEAFYNDKMLKDDRIMLKNEDCEHKLHYTNLIKVKKCHSQKNRDVFEFDPDKQWKTIKGYSQYIIS